MTEFLRTITLLAAFIAACVAMAVQLWGPTVLPWALAAALLLGGGLLLGAGPLLLRLYRARPADETTAPGVVRLAGELAARAGLPAPRVWIVEDPAPGAFATGLGPRHGAIALTTGLLALLSERELRAVLAHELAHIGRRDTPAATLCVALAGGLQFIALAALALLAAVGFSDDGDDEESPGWLHAGLLALLAPLAAAIVLLTLDRGREFEADRWAGELCGDPAALADALAHIERAALGRLPLRAVRRYPQTAALLILPPAAAAGWRRWLASQPSAEGRIERLQAQARAARTAQV